MSNAIDLPAPSRGILTLDRLGILSLVTWNLPVMTDEKTTRVTLSPRMPIVSVSHSAGNRRHSAAASPLPLPGSVQLTSSRRCASNFALRRESAIVDLVPTQVLVEPVLAVKVPSSPTLSV